MPVRIDASPTGITARGLRVRHLDAPEVRRVHLFVDANGDRGIVLRQGLWRFVHVPAEALREPALLQGVRSLLQSIRDTATVDPQVDEFLAEAPVVADAQFADAA